MRNKRPERGIMYLSFALMLVSLLVMGQAMMKANARASSDDFLRFSSILAEVYETIESRYVDAEKLDSEKLFEASIQGMFQALDDHSQFMNADAYEYLNKETEGGFSGVGIHISLRDGILTVIAPIPGSPAARLGILPWDRIIKIEGEETRGITLQEAVNKLTGPEGTKVNVTIYRPSERDTFDLTITRAQIKVDSIYSKLLSGNVGYVRLTKFANDTSGDLKTALLNFHRQGAEGLVIDLRFNTGGLLKEAIAVSDLFLEKGLTIVETRGKDPSQNNLFKSEHEPVSKLPIIILVNSSSASASEIVAAALRDNDRAILLGPKGQRTYGKWSVQTIEELNHSINYDEEGNPRRCAVRLTTARYYSPKGETYHKEGLPFDEEFDVPEDSQRRLLAEGHLLGEPNMIESEEDHLDHFPTEMELNGATPAPEPTSAPALEDESATPPTVIDDALSTPVKSQEPFKDQLLEHAVRLMKTHILLSGRKAA